MLQWLRIVRDFIKASLYVFNYFKKKKIKDDFKEAKDETIRTRNQNALEGNLSDDPGKPTRHEYDKLLTRPSKKRS